MPNFLNNKFFKLALSMASLIVPQIAVVEQIARKLPALRGKAKQDAVVDLVQGILAGSEHAAEADLLSDADVEAATRGVIDAVVALQNIVAAKSAAKAAAPAL